MDMSTEMESRMGTPRIAMGGVRRSDFQENVLRFDGL